MTRSSSAADRPARASTIRAAATARSEVAREPSTIRRVTIPVRATTHSFGAPTRRSSSAFPTIRSGSASPVPRMAQPGMTQDYPAAGCVPSCLPAISATASANVRTRSASSSWMRTPSSSSTAIMISTIARESAPRSATRSVSGRMRSAAAFSFCATRVRSRSVSSSMNSLLADGPSAQNPQSCRTSPSGAIPCAERHTAVEMETAGEEDPSPDELEEPGAPERHDRPTHVRARRHHELGEVPLGERHVDQDPVLAALAEVVREDTELVDDAVAQRHRELEALLVQQPREHAPVVGHELEDAPGRQCRHHAVQRLLAHDRHDGVHVGDRAEEARTRRVEQRAEPEEVRRPHDLDDDRRPVKPLADDAYGPSDQEVHEVVRLALREDLLTRPPVR